MKNSILLSLNLPPFVSVPSIETILPRRGALPYPFDSARFVIFSRASAWAVHFLDTQFKMSNCQ